MKALETGKDKVKKICDILRRETLEPAQEEANEIIESAKQRSEQIIKEAHAQAKSLVEAAHLQTEREKSVFQSSLNQACKQSIEALRQGVEEKFFNQELKELLTRPAKDPKVLADLISAIVKGIEKEGIEGDLSAYVAASVPARSVNELLASEILNKLKEKSVLVGPLEGGVAVKLHNQNFTIDLSTTALQELIARYIRKDFRSMIFSPSA